MSISKRVAEAIDQMNAGDPESALFQICSVLEATATQFYGKKGRGSYKDFIHDNLDLITRIALGPRILNINLAYDLNKNLPPGEKPVPSNADGTFPIQAIFYHAVRCSLYHGAKLPADLIFNDKRLIEVQSDKLILPSSLVSGLIYSVVACPINAAERIADTYGVDIGGWKIPVNSLWGKRAELVALLAAIDAFF
jgi:hypothetical protein